jgi:serine-type D-Ala-D-Ala carboxypeptidase/endopeptidase (penicillin-binding protein 4)
LITRTGLGWLLVSLAAWGQSGPLNYGRQVTALIQSSPMLQRARIGFKVVDLQTEQVVAEQSPASFFTPASNVKLYTTAFALTRLGPDYTFRTELRTPGPWQPGQDKLSGLELVGGGDPGLSGRVMPYAVNSHDGDPLTAIGEMASQLCQAGVREINGDIAGVATRYGPDLYPDGWTLDDSLYGYGAPVSSLVVNDGVVSVTVHPGSPGDLAFLETDPGLEHFVILNQVVTEISDRARIRVIRPSGSSEIVLSGTIGNRAPEWKTDLAVDDPALFASEALLDALRERGIVVRGSATGEYCPPASGSCAPNADPTVAIHTSPPLWETVQVINKVSQNLQAEMLLREASYATSGSGNLDAALAAREEFLKGIGVSPEGTGFSLGDGSGLARQDLATPDSTVALLQSMWRSPVRDTWLASLPTGGVDGSLQHRFHNLVAADHVHAKTGSISHVNSLSGYIETQRHGWLAFSVMVNGTVGPDREVRNFLDAFCGFFLGY